MDIVKFVHNEKTYEIRVICDGHTVYVKAFLDNQPANIFRYTATVENIKDMKRIIGIDAVEHLVDIAKQDIIDGLK